MIKVSIVVPVYNTEKYLKKCIDSLMNQTFKDYEIIVINDCSKGNCDEIIKKYSSKNIKYISNKTNMGIGYNRNLGIRKAKGNYICFVDSDDYVSNDFIEKMYNKCIKENLDICICDYQYIYDNGNIKRENLIEFETTNLSLNPILITKINLGPCNKMFRKEFLIKNNIEFSENLKYEDLSFMAHALLKGEKIGKINENLNTFRVHENSETTTRDERVFDIFRQLDIVKSYYNNSNKYLDELIVSIIFNYTIQQRYQKYDNIRNEFIDYAFDYLNKNNIDYKNSEYLKNRSFFKRIIEKNKILTKIYCYLYKKIKFRG